MEKRTSSRILISGVFLVAVMIGSDVTAQTVAPNKGGQNHAVAEQNPACQTIVSECRNLGFIVGQWKKDNGLWKDCFDPVVKGGSPTRDGEPVSVPVSSSDIQACRAALGHHKQATPY
jgi:hypothetical protein